MLGEEKDQCGWDNVFGIPDLDQLHSILLCAARRGCGACVGCSEQAFEINALVLRQMMEQQQGQPAFPG